MRTMTTSRDGNVTIFNNRIDDYDDDYYDDSLLRVVGRGVALIPRDRPTKPPEVLRGKALAAAVNDAKAQASALAEAAGVFLAEPVCVRGETVLADRVPLEYAFGLLQRGELDSAIGDVGGLNGWAILATVELKFAFDLPEART